MAISTEYTYLIVKKAAESGGGGETWQKLVDIKEFPDLGGAPSTIDTTTLSNHMKTNIPGLIDPGALEFTANYDFEGYKELKKLEGKTCKYGVQFGKDGSDGVHVFEGILSCWPKGGGVEDCVEIGISISVSTEITVGGTSDKATIN